MSYTIDVYRRRLEPTHDIIAFFAFVAFFPQLVAGPIERATNLLPQFYRPRSFDYQTAVDGLRQILWGLFKKVVIADRCALYVNMIFNDSDYYSGSMLVIGAFLFAFQIYGDFSGYSDIAIGTSRLFGFSLMQNFAYPYFSRDIAEFWRCWHISLSTWFRDYLYIPLGGSKGSWALQVRNTFIIFIVSGFWHGANWTFIFWGALNALYFIPLLLRRQNRRHLDIVAADRIWPSCKDAMAMLGTFVLTLLAWIFFRAESVPHAFSYLGGICSASILALPEVLPWSVLLLIAFFLTIEWMGRRSAYAIADIPCVYPWPLRWSFYAMIILIMGMQMPMAETPFIYFQF